MSLFPNLPSAFTDLQKLDAIEREIKYRERVFVRLVATEKMTAEKANYEIEIMKDIAQDYANKVRR